MVRILFICLGNICRSPLAEAIMKVKIKEVGAEASVFVDSAGLIDYHEGELPDSRMRQRGALRGYDICSLSRPIQADDFDKFDYIIGMDDQNVDQLKRKAKTKEEEARIHHINEFFVNYKAPYVADPYYGGIVGFDYAIDLLEDACEGIFKQLISKDTLNA